MPIEGFWSLQLDPVCIMYFGVRIYVSLNMGRRQWLRSARGTCVSRVPCAYVSVAASILVKSCPSRQQHREGNKMKHLGTSCVFWNKENAT